MRDTENGEEQGPRGPRIVDKRVSARAPDRGDQPAPEPAPAEAAAPAPGAAEPGPDSPPSAEAPPGETSAEEGHVWTPEEEERAQEMAREIAERPATDWVLNAAVTLANVAAIKLEVGANEDAQLAIDALASLVNGLGTRLGEAEAPLRQTLAQLQMAFAQGPPTGPAAPQS